MTVSQAVALLTAWHKSQVGYLEKATGNMNYLSSKTANAGSANYTIYGYKMHQLCPAVMDYPAPWCDAYYDCGMVEVFGVEKAKKLLHGFNDYTVESANYYKKNGQWHTSNPKEGDQIFFLNGSGICHTGYVYKVANGYVYTIEGNTSGASGVVSNGGGVAAKSYPLSYNRIAGYGRPDYSILADVAVEGDELTVSQYEELKKMITDNKAATDEIINQICADIQKIIKTMGGTMIYGCIDKNMPEYAHEAVQWCMDKGIVSGVDAGNLNLNDDKLWVCCTMYRLAQYLAKLMGCKV